jgi:hypothetical protein
VGAAVLFFALREIDSAQKSVTWPTVTGTIRSSETVWSHTSNGGDAASAEVIYVYAVRGRRHTSNKVLFGDYGSSDSSRADRIVNEYSPGQAVTVYYNPLDPSLAVLQPGVTIGSWIFAGFGFLFLAIGLGLVWLFSRRPVSTTGSAPPTWTNTPNT